MNRKRGFTLLETLLVIGIIAILLALLFPAVQMLRAGADRVACAANLNQIGLALTSFHNDHGRLPVALHRIPANHAVPELYLGWQAHLLPYLEQEQLYRDALAAFKETVKTWQNPPHRGYATAIRTYVCPADSRLYQPLPDLLGVPTGLSSYVGNGGSAPANGILPIVPGIQFRDILDGLGFTIMVGERPPPDTLQSGRWYTNVQPENSYDRDSDDSILAEPIVYPHDPVCSSFPVDFGPGRTDRPCDRLHYWSMHPAGGNFLFCDGSVRFLPYSAKRLIPKLATRNGGEKVELPD